MPRYHNFFLGLCYACNNYGHKAIDCRSYATDRNAWSRNSYENTQCQSKSNVVGNPTAASGSTYNRFGELNYEIECYRCHNFGHIARNCRNRFTGSSSQPREDMKVREQQTNWKRKQEDLQIEECGIALTTQNSRSHWCVDSGCSRHVNWNKNTFRTLQEKEGTVIQRS